MILIPPRDGDPKRLRKSHVQSVRSAERTIGRDLHGKRPQFRVRHYDNNVWQMLDRIEREGRKQAARPIIT